MRGVKFFREDHSYFYAHAFSGDYSLKFQAETVKNWKKKSRGNAEGLKIKTRVLNPFKVHIDT